MSTTQTRQLAETLIHHSCELKAGETLLIEAYDLPEYELVTELVSMASQLGALPMVCLKNNSVLRSLYQNATEESMRLNGEVESNRMSRADAYIGIRGAENSSELSDVPQEKMSLFRELWWKSVHSEIRIKKTKWVVLRYPTPSMAQSANMSTDAFADFYYRVCTHDYAQMAENLRPLEQRMLQAGDVKIVGPETELTFSIKDIPVIPCFGRRNIPDGEIFTAPVRDSINGVITFNTASRYQGVLFDRIQFTFEGGRIVKATCQGDDAALNHILDTDEGARYTGEWSLGCNNAILDPMQDTLFDEKIGGSFHLTPGQAYEEADNGNRSAIHWDLVMIQRSDFGGGEIWFDDELIRRDGHFVPESLQKLNEGLEKS